MSTTTTKTFFSETIKDWTESSNPDYFLFYLVDGRTLKVAKSNQRGGEMFFRSLRKCCLDYKNPAMIQTIESFVKTAIFGVENNQTTSNFQLSFVENELTKKVHASFTI